MSAQRKSTGPARSGQGSIIKVAPVTRAVRMALAASATALALAGSGAAFAQTCTAPVNGTVNCDGAFVDSIVYDNVADLTLVLGGNDPTTIIPAAGDVGARITGTGALGVTSDADITVASPNDAIGIYAYSADGPVTVDNTGDIDVTSDYGLADGIFASGTEASVTNSGAITATGYSWAAGIEAQGSDLTTVTNSGDITATAATGTAFGVYATGGLGGITVDNTGNITANGYYATGVFTQATDAGDTSITNAGTITAGGAYTSIYATGINAGSSYEGATVAVDNSGSVNVNSYYGSTGVQVISVGDGGTGSVSNTGDIYVNTTAKYGSSGIVVSADGDASIDNAGSITVAFGGTSYGAAALSFAGDASVTNSGDISVNSGKYSYGVLASSSNGMAIADNSGNIGVTGGFYVAAGISTNGKAGTTVTNSGAITAITAVKYGAYGVLAVAGNGDAVVTNTATGTIDAYNVLGTGFGIAGVSTTGGVTLVNDGAINSYGYSAAFGLFGRAREDGDIALTNTGDITVASYAGQAIALYANSADGDVTVVNSGTLTATSTYGLAEGIFASGASVGVDNSGTIAATGFDFAAGIETESTGAATVTNSGDITATATSITNGYYGHAYGIYATGASVAVDNSGIINASGVYATGIRAQGTDAGAVTVSNSGDIVAGGVTLYANGILGASSYENAAVSVDNSGTITANSYYGSIGISILSVGDGGTGSASNSGQITVGSTEYYANTSGIAVTADAGATVANSGGITVTYGDYAYGASALTFNGDAEVDNSGEISVNGGTQAYGALAGSQNGIATVNNSGSIYATSPYTAAMGVVASGQAGTVVSNSGDITVANAKYSFGVNASSSAGDTDVDNSGTITASTGKYNFGVQATAALGDVSVNNNGAINAGAADGSDKYGFGVLARASEGDTLVTNSGSIAANGKYGIGIEAIADLGDVSVANAAGGTIDASGRSTATGIFGVALAGDVGIQNDGSVSATGITYTGYYGGTYGAPQVEGVFGRADAGNVAITNAGTVTASNDGYGSATGVHALAVAGDVTVTNSGDISASASGADRADYYGVAIPVTAVGVDATAYGTATVNNSGTITATDLDQAIGVRFNAGAGILNNSGIIDTTTVNDGRIAVLGSDGVETINNSGDIYGAVVLAGGDDVFNNASGGVWHVDNDSTDFGAGADLISNGSGGLIDITGSLTMGDDDDTISNAGGGTIQLTDGAIYLGGGSGNAFNNAGTIKVSGANNLIDMGTGAVMPSLNTTPLVNSGLIDFIDGAPDGTLTIVGDLGGNGSINIDLTTPSGPADHLVVDGSVVSGTSQTVNVAVDFNGIPAATGTPTPFAYVSGDSTADSFIAGELVGGFDPSNFLSLNLAITSQIDASNAIDDVFSIGVDVAGLNDTGAIAASIGSGAWSLMTSQIGTWRQRMGVVPEPADDRKVSAFLRTFYDKGDISPDARAFNFGQAGNFDYQQTNSGTEVGINFEPAAGFNIGALLGKSRGKQDLTGGGHGSDKLDADVYGFYGTWIAQSGFYIDTSYRAMRFDAKLDSAAGRQKVDGAAGAINVETGYPFELGNGLRLEPQFQYTWTTVDSVFVPGSQTYLRTDDADFHRSRLGVSLWKPIALGAGTLTPYGAVSAVRVDDAKVGYSVGDVFRGNTEVNGTSALVEAGVGYQAGGFSVTGGANWTDGGAVDSFVGGQVVLRYTW